MTQGVSFRKRKNIIGGGFYVVKIIRRDSLQEERGPYCSDQRPAKGGFDFWDPEIRRKIRSPSGEREKKLIKRGSLFEEVKDKKQRV